ncbi:SusC/RagA family TonB-linked outer membrane protein [Segatella maculosa OT 289]|uniref:SusC/RagA family TonB-linked outer membrane protein n=2 Tax=Segatella maculosa TaxID=439703 RepID=H1HML0_9BACT|nr:SusC/RagA family TonB-linked outer membrane protein [Segatella maculosa OT 289]
MRSKDFFCKVVMTAFMLLWTTSICAKTVTGKVLSASDNEPLLGATVIVQGKQGGSVTDLDGNFSIEANDGQTLVVSYIGFITQRVKVNGDNLVIKLEEEANSLNDVVVIGYGVQKKKLVTGANINVKGDDIAKLNTSNPLQALQGQTPGMTIISQSGQPGSGLKVNIRGMGTINGSDPLYIIDGIRGDIASLNPADIESIDVLKDAASAAIYGSQSANGVVLITTKSGKEGRAVVSFDGYVGWQNKPRSVKMLNAHEYMTILDEQAINSGKQPYDWSAYKSIYNADGSVVDTDWVDQMFRKNAQTGSYNIGVTGGSKTGNYALTLGYMNQEGIVGGKDVSNYERYNFRVNSDWQVKPWLKIGEQVSFIYTKNRGVSVGNAYNNTLKGAFGMSPLVPVYGKNNYKSPYLNTKFMDWQDVQAMGNPYGLMMTNTNNENNAARFSANVYADAEWLKDLHFRTVVGYEYYSSDYRNFTPIYEFSDYSRNINQTRVSQNASHNHQLTWTNTLSYSWKWKAHSLNALVGTEAYQFSGIGVGAGQGKLKSGFDDWSHAYISNGTASSPEDGLSASGAPALKQRMFSYFGRAGWNWKETYMLNATLRADASSKFARGNRWGYFPSVSAGWLVSNERFWKPVANILDYFKLRVSWGQVGNQNIGDLMFVSPITTAGVYYLFGNQYGAAAQAPFYGAYESRLANEKVKWETSEQIDLGFDARAIDGRLNINFDWYYKTTKDWLVVAPILATAGTGAPYINGGDVKNTGVEVGLSWSDRLGKDLHYYVNVNGAYNHNEVGNIPTEDGIIHGTDGNGQLYDNSTEFYRASNGRPIGYFWGYKTAGVFQNQQDINDWIAAGNGVLQSDVQPGDVKYYDIDHNGVINDADKVNLGNGMPDFTYGFTLGFDYKGFDFNVTANGMVGNDVVQAYRNVGTKTANYTTEVLSRWTGEGTSNKYPRVTENNINWQFSDLFIHDGSFLRVSNITLGYDFVKILNTQLFSQARLYFQIQNALTFTKYNGMDPEIGYGVNSWASGIDLGYYPRPRTILVGVNLKF